jgi:hypothetical protein
MRAILLIILIVVLALVSFALVAGIFLGIGWVLTLVLPFSLFEGTVVSMIAAVVTFAVWGRILGVLARLLGITPPWEAAEEEEEIPESRFWESKADRTWENWFKYVLANAAYEDLVDSLDWAEDTSEQAMRILSIHLADAAVAGLKEKSPRTKRLRVTEGMLRHQLAQMGGQVYPDEVLETAAQAMNVQLRYWKDEVWEVIRGNLWDEPAEVD